MRCAGIQVTVPPEGLPVTVEEFIEHARINGITVQVMPELLDRELKAATRRAETFLRRSILTQTLSGAFVSDGKDCACALQLELPRGNVQSVSSVVDGKGNAIAGYTLAGNVIMLQSPAYYVPVTVVWVSGYGDATAVPDSVREGILEFATTLYEDRPGNRETKFAGSTKQGLPLGVFDLWRSEQLEV